MRRESLRRLDHMSIELKRIYRWVLINNAKQIYYVSNKEYDSDTSFDWVNLSKDVAVCLEGRLFGSAKKQ